MSHAASDPTGPTIERVTRDVDARISASSRTWSTLTTPRLTSGTTWTSKIATTTMARVTCRVDAGTPALFEVPLTPALATAAGESRSASTATFPAVQIVDTKIDTVVIGARCTLRIRNTIG